MKGGGTIGTALPQAPALPYVGVRGNPDYEIRRIKRDSSLRLQLAQNDILAFGTAPAKSRDNYEIHTLNYYSSNLTRSGI